MALKGWHCRLVQISSTHSTLWAMVWTAIQQGTHRGSWHRALYRHFVIAGTGSFRRAAHTGCQSHAHDTNAISAGDGISKGILRALTKQLYKLTALCQAIWVCGAPSEGCVFMSKNLPGSMKRCNISMVSQNIWKTGLSRKDQWR